MRDITLIFEQVAIRLSLSKCGPISWPLARVCGVVLRT